MAIKLSETKHFNELHRKTFDEANAIAADITEDTGKAAVSIRADALHLLREGSSALADALNALNSGKRDKAFIEATIAVAMFAHALEANSLANWRKANNDLRYVAQTVARAAMSHK